MTNELSARSIATTLRTYTRPLDTEGTTFETWADVIERSHVKHHAKLWADAGGIPIKQELDELRQLGLERSGLVAGRTLWLGGTPYAYTRAASQFNCSGLEASTVYDVVDAFWLLLNGCGVGGLMRAGTLRGYTNPIREMQVVRCNNDKDFRGDPNNRESYEDEGGVKVWRIVFGDSAEAWAKGLGKLVRGPQQKVDKLILDGTNCRGKGGRLKGYGWICNGFDPLAEALVVVHRILNDNAGNLLNEEDMLDIFNVCGQVLSSRRAAEAGLMDSHHPLADQFAHRKHEYWLHNPHRRQSNNTLLFWQRPGLDDIVDLLRLNLKGGEPGFANAAAALRRCPWFRTFNPCFEILLHSHSFCNLVSLCLPMFGRNIGKLMRAIWLMARANYRQTCVNLEDGVLQPRWNQTNDTLRLCGVSLTGIVQAPWLTDYHIRQLRNSAISGAYSMADELGLPRPKAVTTIKPEGTRSKISGYKGAEVAEGMHTPLGKHILNWINFSVDDPLVTGLQEAGYKTMINPQDRNNILVRFPVEYADGPFAKLGDGRMVNNETAVTQLNRYRRWNRLWADHNVSSSIYLTEEEVPDTAKWLHDNWEEDYIATAFFRKQDPTVTLESSGHPYLPQEVVTPERFAEVNNKLRPVDWARYHRGIHEIGEAGCDSGACPVK